MKCKPYQLAAQLKTALPPVALISGSEPMLVQESVKFIRKAAQASGCSEHLHRMLLVDTDLEQVLAEITTGSLFASKRLCEVHCQFDRSSPRISAMLLKLAEVGDSTTPVLIVVDRIDKTAASKPWVQYIQAHGLWVEVWPLSEQEHSIWIEKRLARHRLKIDPEALHILSEFTIGNLTVADQEIRKLALLHSDNHQISAQDILAATADSARFTLYKLLDNALEGNLQRTIHSWHLIQLGGITPFEVSAQISRSLHDMVHLSAAIAEQQDRREVARRLKIIPSRQAIYEKALRRLKHSQIIRLMCHASTLERLIKGMCKGDSEQAIEAMLLAICGKYSPALYQIPPGAPAL